MTPYFKSMSEFIAMGDHGYYVWLCYALTADCYFGIIIYTQNERKALIKKLSRQHARGRLANKQRRQ